MGHGLIAMTMQATGRADLVKAACLNSFLDGYAGWNCRVNVPGGIMAGGTVAFMLDINIGPGI